MGRVSWPRSPTRPSSCAHAWGSSLRWAAQTPGAFPYNGDDDRAALMLVRRRENRQPPDGFTKAYDLWGTPTQDQWARSNPADPPQKSETFLITEDGWGMPDFASAYSSAGDKRSTTQFCRKLMRMTFPIPLMYVSQLCLHCRYWASCCPLR